MYIDAEERKAELMALNEADGVVFKMKNDPRVTTVGAFLRKYSLDELPQLINVLKGEMSLVGPRPEMPFIVDTYNELQRERLRVKPGITGLAQVEGVDMTNVIDAMRSGVTGKIIDVVDDEDGEHVEIYIE